jgi:hypothetical protein
LSNRTCTQDGCDRQHYAKGWCKGHYKREAARTAALSGQRKTLRNLSPSEVIAARTRSTEAGCWEWQGARDPKGYGRLGYNGVQYLAHRFSFESSRGPVEDEMTLDHLCRNTSCVNPAHLEAVTRSENARRAWLPRVS